MDRKTIEKAVNDYVGYEPEVDEGLGTRMRRDAFWDGAEWRINSVWHDGREVPEANKRVLVCFETDIDKIVYYRVRAFKPNVIKNWNTGHRVDEILYWAYLDDLLPDRKEE